MCSFYIIKENSNNNKIPQKAPWIVKHLQRALAISLDDKG